MASILDIGFGLEEMATEAFAVLFAELNGELALIDAEKAPRDESLAILRGQAYVPVELEEVEAGSFHLGHIPSLILDSTPIDSYPAVSVMAHRAGPHPTDSLYDQVSVYRDSLYAEILVKASPAEGEEVCNKRSWRSADAINRVMMRNQTLNGVINELGSSPTAITSEVFMRPRSDDDDTSWFWQGSRIEYAPSKVSPFA